MNTNYKSIEPLYPRYIKKSLDLIFSITGLLLLAPFLLVVTLLLAIGNKGNPFFFQKRPGKNGKIFLLVKFKTMNDRRDAEGKLLPDESRITPMGKFVRKYSIDELLQLINVAKGDMSLIGPRPLLVDYLPLYNERQSRRHDVKPGITGWAQVKGRNAISWEQKFELDVWYVEHISFSLDCKIFWLTVKKTIMADDISNSGHATMPYFKGADTI